MNSLRDRLIRWRDEPGLPNKILVAAMAVYTAVILWLGRDATFSGDEIRLVVETPNLNLETVFRPHGGHLLALGRIGYWTILEVTGLAYLPFRVLAVLSILLVIGLFYVWAKRRVDPWIALSVSLVLLFFGADPLHTFQGNGFIVMLSIALGLAALLSFERGDRRGDIACAAFLVLGVSAYSVILPFIAGLTLLIVLSRQWSRGWIVLLPLCLYLLWRVWLVLADVTSDGSEISIQNILLLPAWSFQSVAGILDALSGLGYDFSGARPLDGVIGPAGPALAVLAFVALGFAIRRLGVGRTLATTLVITAALWAMQAVVATDLSGQRMPGADSRYMYPGGVIVALVAIAAAGPFRPANRALVLLAVATVSAVGVNLMVLRDNAQHVRELGEIARAQVGAFVMVGAVNREITETRSFVESLAAMAGSPYGEFGYGLDQLQSRPEAERQQLDRTMARLGGATLEAEPVSSACGRAFQVSSLAPGESVIKSGLGGELTAGRLADEPSVELGSLEPGQAYRVVLPGTGDPAWELSVPSGDLSVCEPKGTSK